MLILIAKFNTKPEHRSTMMELAKGLLEPSRSEAGCIHYEFLQDPFEPDSFTFYEKWDSQDALDLHFQKPYFIDFSNKFPQLIKGEHSLETYEVAQ